MSLSSSSEKELEEIYYKIIKSIGKTKYGELFLVTFDEVDINMIKEEKKRKKKNQKKRGKRKRKKKIY